MPNADCTGTRGICLCRPCAYAVERKLAVEPHALDEPGEEGVDVIGHRHALKVHEVQLANVLCRESHAFVHGEVARRELIAGEASLPLPRVGRSRVPHGFQQGGVAAATHGEYPLLMVR